MANKGKADAARKGKTDEAWAEILDAHPDIVTTIEAGQYYRISADEIRKYREPRLMTKHDTSSSVPLPLKKHGINVLPLSRTEYALCDFSLFQTFPDTSGLRAKFCSLPDFETLRVDKISSESNAINALVVGGILDDFLGTENTVETFNGRMTTERFTFNVDCAHGTPMSIKVDKAQIEIDGGFENDESVIIMEAKNLRHDDFHVRQLYYPYRKYHAFVTKPIRLVFSQYTNLTYYLYEYEFEDPENYNSLKLLRHEAFTFEDTRITASELYNIWEMTPVKYDDNQANTDIPFIQADRFDRVISLMEQLSRTESGCMTTDEVTQFMGTVQRQASYYPAAGEYLGLFARTRGEVALTSKARHILQLSRRDRELEFAKLMFSHEIFHRFFLQTFTSGVLPSANEIKHAMLELNVCNDGSTMQRRAQTVIAWLKWIMSIIDEEA